MTKCREEELLEEYYENNASKLKSLIRLLVAKYGVVNKDIDDYYSVGNEVFTLCLNSFNEDMSKFETYLTRCLSKRFKNEIIAKNSKKRKAEVVSGDDSLMDSAESKYGVEDVTILFHIIEKLPREEYDLCLYRINGYTDTEIKKKLCISNRAFYKMLNSLRNKISA